MKAVIIPLDGRREPSVCLAWRAARAQCLSRLASGTNPVFISLGGWREPSVYLAWRAVRTQYLSRLAGGTNPVFISLGGQHEPSVYLAWRAARTQCLSRLAGGTNPVFIPLGRLSYMTEDCDEKIMVDVVIRAAVGAERTAGGAIAGAGRYLDAGSGAGAIQRRQRSAATVRAGKPARSGGRPGTAYRAGG